MGTHQSYSTISRSKTLNFRQNILVRRSGCLYNSKMKQVTVMTIAVGCFFLVGYSTAKYLLVEIENEVDVGMQGVKNEAIPARPVPKFTKMPAHPFPRPGSKPRLDANGRSCDCSSCEECGTDGFGRICADCSCNGCWCECYSKGSK